MTADAYEELVRLAERELELAGEGRYDEIAQLQRERRALISTLPATPPASARSALRRAELMQERVTIELLRGRDGLLQRLRQVAAIHRAAGGYRSSLGLRGPRRRFDANV